MDLSHLLRLSLSITLCLSLCFYTLFLSLCFHLFVSTLYITVSISLFLHFVSISVFLSISLFLSLCHFVSTLCFYLFVSITKLCLYHFFSFSLVSASLCSSHCAAQLPRSSQANPRLLVLLWVISTQRCVPTLLAYLSTVLLPSMLCLARVHEK